MLTLEHLVVELATDATKYAKGLGDASNKTSSWGANLAGIAGKAALGAMAAAGAAIAGVGVAGVKEFTGFQTSMNEVFTLLPGLSADAMGKMQGDVKNFAKEFGVLPSETVPALYQAISAGVPKDNVFTFLEVAQKAARGGVTDLETAVDGISSTVNAYGSDVIDAATASDLMFTAVKLGKTTFEELSSSLFNVNPTAAALGVNFGDVTAALAAMTAQGVPTSVATTQLRQLLVELSKSGTGASKAFTALAGTDFQSFIAQGNNLQDALNLMAGGLTTTSDNSTQVAAKTQQLQERYARLSDQLVVAKQRQAEFNDKTKDSTRLSNQQTIDRVTAEMEALSAEMSGLTVVSETSTTKMSDLFGSVEAGNAALALTGQGAEAFSKALAEMGASSGATQTAFDTMNGGIGASLDRLKATWATTLLDIGEKAAPAFTGLLAVAQQALPVVADMFVWVADAAAKGVEWITANWPAISDAVMGIIEPIQAALTPVIDGISLFFNRLQGGSDLLTSIRDAISKFVYGLTSSEESAMAAGKVFQEFLEPALIGARDTFAWVKDWIDENMPLIRKTVETIVGAISAFWDTHGEKIMRIVRNFMGIVTTIFDTYLKNAFDIVKVVMQLITGDFEGAGETLRGIAERTFTAIFDIISAQLDNVRTLITGIDWGALGRAIIDGIVDGVKGAAYLLGEAARGAAEGALNGIKDLLGIHSPSRVMAQQVGAPMAEGIASGFQDTLRRASWSVAQALDLGSGRVSAFGAMDSIDRIGSRSPAPSQAGQGQTNYITFNITATDQDQARAGVLSGLRAAGVAV